MGRWEPDSRGRLERAALELYSERGFDNTTVAEIAERAGLTERTFFRHFADKREVLFAGGSALQDAMVSAVAVAPESLSPIEAVAVGVEAAGTVLQERRPYARQRQAIIAANVELRERELMKLESMGGALTDAMRGRGLPDSDARLTAEVGMAVFRITFQRWIDEGNDRAFADLVREAVDQLEGLTKLPV